MKTTSVLFFVLSILLSLLTVVKGTPTPKDFDESPLPSCDDFKDWPKRAGHGPACQPRDPEEPPDADKVVTSIAPSITSGVIPKCPPGYFRVYIKVKYPDNVQDTKDHFMCVINTIGVMDSSGRIPVGG